MVCDGASDTEGHETVTSTPDQLAPKTPGSLQASIQEGIKAEIAPLFDELRRFTDRRIAELSSEIHATVQLFDFGEANLSSQLAKIQEQVAVMVAVPAAATRNSGLELEAVVQATEAAANQIMEAAEAIGDWLRDGARDVALDRNRRREAEQHLRGLHVSGCHRPTYSPRHTASAACGDHADRGHACDRGGGSARAGGGESGPRAGRR